MTFDDGQLAIYSVTDSAAPGEKPVATLTLKSEHYYRYETIGVTRYYQALQADQQISNVVVIPDWHDIRTTDLCVLDGNISEPFDISFVQPTYDEDRLKITKITLGKVDQSYDIMS